MSFKNDKPVMTIADGLSQKKILRARMQDDLDFIKQYGAVNNKRRTSVGDQKDTVKNHNETQEKVLAAYQSFKDLSENYFDICEAVDRTNQLTQITVGGRSMSMARALHIQRVLNLQTVLDPKKGFNFYRMMISSIDNAFKTAQKDVDNFNNNQRQANQGLDAESIQSLMAEVLYFIPVDDIKEMQNFLGSFLQEIDGTLNKMNAITNLIWE